MDSLRYTARDFAASLPAADCIARFRDAARIERYCRSCPGYGCNWGCPPFDSEADRIPSGCRTALVVATKIVPAVPDLPIAEAERLIRPERLRLEEGLFEMERRYGGRMFAAGRCQLCPQGNCTRPLGEPCRHPDRLRPSLEACGFDLVQLCAELFGIPLRWGSEGRMPEYLTLVGALFHPAEEVRWIGWQEPEAS